MKRRYPFWRNISICCLLCVACCLYLCGCGYTTRGFLYEEDEIVIIPVVNKINITSEGRRFSQYTTFPILLEKQLTNALINKFNIDGHLKVTRRKEEALELLCTITDYRRETLRYTDSDDVKEQRLRLHVHMKLSDFDGEILQEKNVVGETEFFLSGPHSKSEAAAQVELVDDAARRIVEAVIEEW
ncbi:MAG: hypothetical protein JSW40_10070 [Candidatus Omnitrophota bacterium]|nr:MAG: hypothetical protein JSW40_10070 [Candidatus Omnitrophota bacterium]